MSRAGVAQADVVSRTRQGRTIGLDAGRPLEERVTARHPAHMEPPILRPGDPEGQEVVVGVCAPDQDLPSLLQGVGEDAATAIVRA